MVIGRERSSEAQAVNDAVALLLMFVALAVVVLVSLLLHFKRSNVILQKWAEEHGYRILVQEYRSWRRGPFFWSSSKQQTVYYVVVEDPQGCRRSGYVRCGGWFLGLWSDAVEVRWDA
jgi:hypothetical protein